MSAKLSNRSEEIDMTHGGYIDVSSLPFGTNCFIAKCGRTRYHVEVKKNATNACVTRWRYAAGSRYDASADSAMVFVGNSACLYRAQIEELKAIESASKLLQNNMHSLGLQFRQF